MNPDSLGLAIGLTVIVLWGAGLFLAATVWWDRVKAGSGILSRHEEYARSMRSLLVLGGVVFVTIGIALWAMLITQWVGG